jgi:hypothetical protein
VVGSGSASISIAYIPSIDLSIRKLHNSLVSVWFLSFIQWPGIDNSNTNRLVLPGKVENMSGWLWGCISFGVPSAKLV